MKLLPTTSLDIRPWQSPAALVARPFGELPKLAPHPTTLWQSNHERKQERATWLNSRRAKTFHIPIESP